MPNDRHANGMNCTRKIQRVIILGSFEHVVNGGTWQTKKQCVTLPWITRDIVKMNITAMR